MRPFLGPRTLQWGVQLEADRVDVYMPFVVGDYLRDTFDLDCEEHGAYFLLLVALWNARGVLPSDSDRLRKLARVPNKRRWASIWRTISRFFDEADGQITQRRLTAELDRARDQKRLASEAGKASAAARAAAKGNDKPAPGQQPVNVGPTEGQQNANDPSTEGQRNVNPSSSSSSSSSKSEKIPPVAGDPPAHALAENATSYGLIAAMRVAMERARPERGFWDPGSFAHKEADELLDALPTGGNARSTAVELLRNEIKQFAENKQFADTSVKGFRRWRTGAQQSRNPQIGHVAVTGSETYPDGKQKL